MDGDGLVCVLGGPASTAAATWEDQHPMADDWVPCCTASAMAGRQDACTCWEPVYDLEQAAPQLLASVTDLQIRARPCEDCAYRPGSPERSSGHSAEKLQAITYRPDTPFYCHDGMRRPTHWVHPDGRTVPGEPADYQPPVIAAVPYRADGRPGLLCAGWAAQLAAHHPTPAAPAGPPTNTSPPTLGTSR
jgi:hypothetical protein